MPSGGEEFALSRPCVIKDADLYRMWYSRRHPTYRPGYAESADGLSWERRDDELRFVPAAETWEQESMSYPAVFDHGGRRFMFYNGNSYGRTGFGIAILEAGGA
jgi:hypothetical protein